MENLAYSELKLQKSEEIPEHEAKNLFKFKENYGERYESKGCLLCAVHLDTQAHSQQCEEVKEKISIEGRYSDI